MKKFKDNKHWKIFAIVIVIVYALIWGPFNQLYLNLKSPNEPTSEESVLNNIEKVLDEIQDQNLEIGSVDIDYKGNLNIEIMNNIDRDLTPSEIKNLYQEILGNIGTNEEIMSKIGPPIGVSNDIRFRVYRPLDPYYNQHDILIENGKLDLVAMSFELSDFKAIKWDELDQEKLREIAVNYDIYNTFVEKIKVLEMNEHKLYSLDITYDEFLKNIDGVLTESYAEGYLRELNKDPILKVDEEVILIGDLENTSEEKYEDYREILDNNGDEIIIKTVKSIEITDAQYEGLFDGDKRAYSKTLLELYRSEKVRDQGVLVKAYNFVKENGKWCINNIKENSIRVEAGEELPNLPYETDSKDEYIETISIGVD